MKVAGSMLGNVSRTDKMRLAIWFPFHFVSSYASRFTGRFLPVVKVTRNWWSVLLVYFGAEKGRRLFRNGESFRLSRKDLAEFTLKVELEALPKRVKAKLRREDEHFTYLAGGKTLA